MNRFARLSSATCPDHEVVAWELARQFGHERRIPEGRMILGDLARRLPLVESGDEQIDALADFAHRYFRASAIDDVHAPVLLTDVVETRFGHPVGVATAVATVAARVGYSTDLAGAGARLLVAHPDVTVVVDPEAPRGAVDARGYGVDILWRCAHEVAALTLRQIRARADHRGDIGRALAASALSGVLPLAHHPVPHPDDLS